MIDLPDHGYTSVNVQLLDPGGTVAGSLGGPSQTVDRPGVRYSVRFSLPMLNMYDARIFQSLLEQGSRDDVSYPWPLDFAVPAVGAPLVNGASATGSVIPVKGLLPGFQFKQGQPLAVISGGYGFIHKAVTPVAADAGGLATVSVFPLTRKAFVDGDVIEVQRPRIRGVLSWDGAAQGAYGRRGFTFGIQERI